MRLKIVIHILQLATLYIDYEQNVDGQLLTCLLLWKVPHSTQQSMEVTALVCFGCFRYLRFNLFGEYLFII